LGPPQQILATSCARAPQLPQLLLRTMAVPLLACACSQIEEEVTPALPRPLICPQKPRQAQAQARPRLIAFGMLIAFGLHNGQANRPSSHYGAGRRGRRMYAALPSSLLAPPYP
jgi:hypothetical protein